MSDITRREFLETSALAAAALTGSKALSETVFDTEIVTAKIFPGIGIARVGDSTDRKDFFIGPEVIDPASTTPEQIRDATGLKRQAARFRIYGYNKAGEVVREITGREARIEWTAHLVNKKAAWYRFSAALDIPESAGIKDERRNAKVKGADRKDLVIDGGVRTVTATSRRASFNGGHFLGQPVTLGELRLDREGRLLVLGGRGKAGGLADAPIYDPSDEASFNNANGWWDDIADGPVDAKVWIGNREIPNVTGAWIAVAPPNYAPDIVGWRTLYDLLTDVYIRAGMLAAPAHTSFTRDVLPLLKRLTGLQWVNKGIAVTHPCHSETDFESEAIIARLNDPKESVFHKKIYLNFRLPTANTSSKTLWPMLYGDSFGSSPADAPNNNFIVQGIAVTHLKNWAEGKYLADWKSTKGRKRVLESLSVKEQPDMLNRAALHSCLADAFHPGCELTWPMRHPEMYAEPFRIKRATPEETERGEPDYGDVLTQAICNQAEGPVKRGKTAGDLTKWMAMPWHGDTAFCRSGYEPTGGPLAPYLPTFWPARVPNHVLTEADYAIVIDPSKTAEERKAAFLRRGNWMRSFSGSAPNQMLDMIRRFSAIGFVVQRPGVNDPKLPELPSTMFVENLPVAVATAEAAQNRGPIAKSAGKPDPVLEAGWEDLEQLNEFRRIRGVRPPTP